MNVVGKFYFQLNQQKRNSFLLLFFLFTSLHWFICYFLVWVCRSPTVDTLASGDCKIKMSLLTSLFKLSFFTFLLNLKRKNIQHPLLEYFSYWRRSRSKIGIAHSIHSFDEYVSKLKDLSKDSLPFSNIGDIFFLEKRKWEDVRK